MTQNISLFYTSFVYLGDTPILMFRNKFFFLPLLLILLSTDIHAKREMDSASLVIRNISYNGKIYSASDSAFFKIRLFYGNPAPEWKNVKYYSNNEILRYTFHLLPVEDTTGGAKRNIDFYIKPASDSITVDQLMIDGVFHKNTTVIIDTLFFCCGYNVLTVKTSLASEVIHVPGRSVTNNFIYQDPFIRDSICMARSKAISESSSLQRLNRGKPTVLCKRQFMCSDTVTMSISMCLSKDRTLVTDFYANGNINRIFTQEKYSEWKFFYHQHHWGPRDNEYWTFSIIKRLHKTRFVDTCTNYYPNGHLYKQTTAFTNNENVGYRVVNAWDTNGVQTLFNGNGYYTEYTMWSEYKSYSIKHYTDYKLDGDCDYYHDGILVTHTEWKNGILYHQKMTSDRYTRIMDYDPATDTYHILDTDKDGHVTMNKTFPAKDINNGADESWIYFYPDAGSAFL